MWFVWFWHYLRGLRFFNLFRCFRFGLILACLIDCTKRSRMVPASSKSFFIYSLSIACKVYPSCDLYGFGSIWGGCVFCIDFEVFGLEWFWLVWLSPRKDLEWYRLLRNPSLWIWVPLGVSTCFCDFDVFGNVVLLGYVVVLRCLDLFPSLWFGVILLC